MRKLIVSVMLLSASTASAGDLAIEIVELHASLSQKLEEAARHYRRAAKLKPMAPYPRRELERLRGNAVPGGK